LQSNLGQIAGVTTERIAPGETSASMAGVDGNSPLTASTGIVLTVLLLVEGWTVLDVRGYITLHAFIGLVLIGPIALKCATTMYRFTRYYTGQPGYVKRGAPPVLLRLIGPLVILSSVAVLGTGVALLAGTAPAVPGWPCQRAELDKPALAKDCDAITQRLHLAQDVRRQQDSLAVVLRFMDALPECLFHERIEPAGRLIEDQQVGAGHQRRDEQDLLPVALRVGPSFPARIKNEPIDQEVAVAGVHPAMDAAEEMQDLRTGEGRPQDCLARDICESAMDRHRVALTIESEDLRPSPRRPCSPEQQPDGRRLAGPVRAEVTDDLPRPDLQVEVGERICSAVPFAKAFGVNRCRRHRESSTPSPAGQVECPTQTVMLMGR
jgi:hypothetical protein